MQEKLAKSKARMVRKQVFITAEQNRSLKAMAAALTRSEGDLIREAVTQHLAKQSLQDQDWKAAWRDAAGMWEDYPEIEHVVQRNRDGWRKRREHNERRLRGENK